VVEDRSDGVERWSIGVLEYWSIEVLKSTRDLYSGSWAFFRTVSVKLNRPTAPSGLGKGGTPYLLFSAVRSPKWPYYLPKN
jgi:hypothetical protein